MDAVPPPGYERERFEEMGALSLPWIEREIKTARSRLVITLGAKVAGIFRGMSGSKARTALLGPEISSLQYGETEAPTVHLSHPGIVMRNASVRILGLSRTQRSISPR